MRGYEYAFEDRGFRLSSIIDAESLRHAASLFFNSPNGEVMTKKHNIDQEVSLQFPEDSAIQEAEARSGDWVLTIRVYQRGQLWPITSRGLQD
jgi:hypothetical protein